MSLKDNMSYIKEEISQEEKFFESFFKLEKFYKKYKYIIFGSVALAIVYFIGSSVMTYVQENNKKEANVTYNKATLSPQDTQLLDTLKSQNEKLYEAVLFQSNKNIENPQTPYLKELQTYKQAVEKKDLVALNTLIASQDFLLRDFAMVNKALIEIDAGEFAKAKITLKSIAEDSSVAPLAQILNHFLLTK